jgi:probable rRNA maturation factor
LAIRFFLHLVDYQIEGKRKIKTWIRKILTDHDKMVGEINIILTCDSKLLEINKRYLKKENYTDIITFDYSDKKVISGELYISIDRIKENANIYNVTCNNEVVRVIIHGILHLLNYDDNTYLKKKKMKKMEDNYLNNLYKKGSENI